MLLEKNIFTLLSYFSLYFNYFAIVFECKIVQPVIWTHLNSLKSRDYCFWSKLHLFLNNLPLKLVMTLRFIEHLSPPLANALCQSPLVLEMMTNMWKVYDGNYGQQTQLTWNGLLGTTNKINLRLWLRWRPWHWFLDKTRSSLRSFF